jgi:hypothetical protein
MAARGGGMPHLQGRRDPAIGRSYRGSQLPGDGPHPTPFGALSASAKDLPASFSAASNACCHRAHLISAISGADMGSNEGTA